MGAPLKPGLHHVMGPVLSLDATVYIPEPPLKLVAALIADAAKEVRLDNNEAERRLATQDSGYQVSPEGREYLRAQFEAHCSIPHWLKK